MRGLAVKGSLKPVDLHRALQWSPEGADVVLDLSGMDWCEPAGLVAVAALAERAIDGGEDAVLRAPANANIANYLARMRLGRVLTELGAQHDLPRVREWPLGDSLVELTGFSSYRESERAAERVRDTTEAKCGDEVATELFEALIEGVQNVVYHARVTRGFVAAQAFPTKRVVKFAVADSGVGLQNSLSLRGAETDGEAIDLALGGVSSLDDEARGNGFPTMIDVTRKAGGTLEIITGRAWYDGRRTRDERRSCFDGTLLQGVLRYAG